MLHYLYIINLEKLYDMMGFTVIFIIIYNVYMSYLPLALLSKSLLTWLFTAFMLWVITLPFLVCWVLLIVMIHWIFPKIVLFVYFICTWTLWQYVSEECRVFYYLPSCFSCDTCLATKLCPLWAESVVSTLNFPRLRTEMVDNIFLQICKFPYWLL